MINQRRNSLTSINTVEKVVFEDGRILHMFEDFPFLMKDGKTVFHYTCNAPSKKTLEKYGIQSRGEELFGIEGRGIMEIPVRVYKKFGLCVSGNPDVLKINSEILMRDLS